MQDNLSALQFDAACRCAALRRAGRAITQFYDLVLAPSSLKITQFIMLKTLKDAGEVAQCDYAREHVIAVETLSRRFSTLRRKGLVQVRVGERHGEKIYSLSADGEAALSAALPYWELAQHRLHTALGEPDWEQVLEVSNRICIAAHSAQQARTKNHIPAAAKATSQEMAAD